MEKKEIIVEVEVEVKVDGLDGLEDKIQELNEIVAKAKSLAEEIALTTVTVSNSINLNRDSRVLAKKINDKLFNQGIS